VRTWCSIRSRAALDLDSALLTENTRAAYPISYIDNHVADGLGGHPRHIVMLTRMRSACCRRSRG